MGATRVYVCPARDQLFLLPVCMRDWLEEGHLAWFVLDVVAELDTGGCIGGRGVVRVVRRMSRRCWWRCCCTRIAVGCGPRGGSRRRAGRMRRFGDLWWAGA